MAAIQPASQASRSANNSRNRTPPVLALPKGLVDPGEKPVEAALREVYEETGVTAELVGKLGDVKYAYTRSWGDKQRVFKIVSFYLMRYLTGRINEITPEMRVEVARARWIDMEDAPSLLTYKGDKQMAQRARDYVSTHSEWKADKLP